MRSDGAGLESRFQEEVVDLSDSPLSCLPWFIEWRSERLFLPRVCYEGRP